MNSAGAFIDCVVENYQKKDSFLILFAFGFNSCRDQSLRIQGNPNKPSRETLKTVVGRKVFYKTLLYPERKEIVP
jgi:hypothetical protein